MAWHRGAVNVCSDEPKGMRSEGHDVADLHRPVNEAACEDRQEDAHANRRDSSCAPLPLIATLPARAANLRVPAAMCFSRAVGTGDDNKFARRCRKLQ